MSNEKRDLKELLEKYRNNNLSPSEYDTFLRMIGEPGAEGIIEDMATSDWNEGIDILQRTKAEEPAADNQPRTIRWVLSIAASVALLMALYLYLPERQQKERFLTYKTSYGETKTVLLPDSSKVLMNANSQLVWDGDWQGSGTRKAKLDGEGFFEVKKVHGSSFILESGGVKVRVLGTVFNVRNRRGKVDVFLESGRVNLEMAEARQKTVTLVPGNSVHYNNEKGDVVLVQSSTLTQSASWVDGMLEFQNESLQDILNRFEELYGKKFQIENPALLNKRMDLSLPYSNWDLISKALKISLHVEFVEKQDTVIVK